MTVTTSCIVYRLLLLTALVVKMEGADVVVVGVPKDTAPAAGFPPKMLLPPAGIKIDWLVRFSSYSVGWLVKL